MLGRRLEEFLRCSRNWCHIFVEAFLVGWRRLKYEEAYLKAYQNVLEAKAGIGADLRLYNDERPHQALDYQLKGFPGLPFDPSPRLATPGDDISRVPSPEGVCCPEDEPVELSYA